MIFSRLAVSMMSGLVVVAWGIASAQSYPNKPIRIVTAGAGGGSDFQARQIAQGISGPLGQPVIVENRGGGLTPEILLRAGHDGYTVSLSGANLWITPLLRKAPYEMKDFVPISLISREVNLLVVNPGVPAKSVKELIALAKSKPGELNYAGTTVGGPQQLGAELFKSMAGVNIVSVPYKSAVAAVTAVISGEVQMLVIDAGLVAPHVKSGKLRALGVGSAEPSALVPGLPTVSASGLPGYEWSLMSGMFAPAGTPAAVINRLNLEIVRVLRTPEVRERFLNTGIEIVGSSPEEFAAIVKSDTAKTAKVIKEAGIKVD